ncbi:MAG TPA: fumarylacetoacetate hydrolase family protein [Tepidisphaeraceae bacterium]|nr:fumarylacetoacetate hydrolase family protein [Tepidisphaeraceae bacterium]
MRIVRFISAGEVHLGRQVDAEYAMHIGGQLFGPHKVTDRKLRIEKLLSPFVPADILCIGLNYRQHAKESGSAIPQHPMLFIKSGNALNNPGDPIFIPLRSSQIDFEGELAIVIGKNAKNVSRADAMEYVFGYTCANDVTARDWQRDKALGGGQFARGKSFDSFCPLGPCIITRDEIPNPNALRIRTTLNGQLMQDNTTGDMIFDVPAIIESLSSTMTLREGAVILTGTPQGVGFARNPPVWLKAGDSIAVEIEGVGTLENAVRAEMQME